MAYSAFFQGVLGVLDVPVVIEGHLNGLRQIQIDSAIGRYAADDDDRIDFLILCPLVSCLFSALSGIVSDFLSQFFAQFRRNVDRADSIGGFLSLGFGSGSLPLLGLFGLDFLLFCLGPGLDAFRPELSRQDGQRPSYPQPKPRRRRLWS